VSVWFGCNYCLYCVCVEWPMYILINTNLLKCIIKRIISFVKYNLMHIFGAYVLMNEHSKRRKLGLLFRRKLFIFLGGG